MRERNLQPDNVIFDITKKVKPEYVESIKINLIDVSDFGKTVKELEVEDISIHVSDSGTSMRYKIECCIDNKTFDLSPFLNPDFKFSGYEETMKEYLDINEYDVVYNISVWFDSDFKGSPLVTVEFAYAYHPKHHFFRPQLEDAMFQCLMGVLHNCPMIDMERLEKHITDMFMPLHESLIELMNPYMKGLNNHGKEEEKEESHSSE